jgi:hypothetical protein
MITNIKSLEAYCKDYTQIENYEEAVKSPLRYNLHHRLEISEMQSRSDLKFLHLYYNRPAEELIFLEHGEHMRLHKANLSAEARKKMSDALKGNQCALGHHCSKETRQKMSDALKGKPKSLETRQKMSVACRGEKNSMFGRHWHLENGRRIYTD